MKIKILLENKKRFTIFLPTSFIKSKLLYKYLYNDKDKNEQAIIQTRQFVKKMYKEIKKYISNNGHFVFIEVYNSDCFIKIII